MGFGQTMLTAAFLVLITIAAMNANKMIVERDVSYYEQEAFQQSAMLADALLSEIMTKDFDENASEADGTYNRTRYRFTTPSSLGPEGSEGRNVNPGGAADNSTPYRSFIYFDDVDDYHGYKRTATSGSLPGFELTAQVAYVDSSDLELPTTSTTYYKRIIVTVTNTTYFRKRDRDGDGIEENVSLDYSSVKSY